MLKISEQEVIKRYDSLPQILKEALFSEESDNLLWSIGESYHLSDERKSSLALIVGDVILGFLHSEDLAKAIKEDIGLNPDMAESISREIDKKIFKPIRSEIEKVYSPAAPVVSDIEPPVVGPSAELRTSSIEPFTTEETGEMKIVELPKPEEAEKEEIKDIFEGAVPVSLEKIGGAGIESAAEEKPAIIHEETELKPIKDASKSFSLGSFFSFLKKKEKPIDESLTTVEIETPVSPQAETEPPFENLFGIPEIKPEVKSPEAEVAESEKLETGIEIPKELQTPEIKVPEIKEPEIKELEIKEPETKEEEIKQEIAEPEIKIVDYIEPFAAGGAEPSVLATEINEAEKSEELKMPEAAKKKNGLFKSLFKRKKKEI